MSIKGKRRKSHEDRDEFEINEGDFLDSMRTLVKNQLAQLTTIASIQDQMVDMIREHDERSAWARLPWMKSLFNPYTYSMRTETLTILMLAIFLVLQIFIQLAFKGHFNHLVPHVPDFIQAILH